MVRVSGCVVMINYEYVEYRIYSNKRPGRLFKVTVQFEIEGNGQNEIFSHMDRSKVKL